MTRTPRSLVTLLALTLVLAACAEPASSVALSGSPSVQPTRSPTPEPTVGPTAEPASEAPSPSASDGGELRPFAVAANPAADTLFLDRDDCANQADSREASMRAL